MPYNYGLCLLVMLVCWVLFGRNRTQIWDGKVISPFSNGCFGQNDMCSGISRGWRHSHHTRRQNSERTADRPGFLNRCPGREISRFYTSFTQPSKRILSKHRIPTTRQRPPSPSLPVSTLIPTVLTTSPAGNASILPRPRVPSNPPPLPWRRPQPSERPRPISARWHSL